MLAVNKMDLVDYDQAVFDAIVADYRAFADQIGIDDWIAIPVSGLSGDNVARAQRARCPGTTGRACSSISTACRSTATADAAKPFRMPVQWVNRPDQDFRGFAGLIAAGAVAPGDEVRVLPSGRIDTVERIVTARRRPGRRRSPASRSR